MSFLTRLLGRSKTSMLSATEFVARRDAETPVIDVRTASEFASGHLADAVNVDVMASDFRNRIAALDLGEGPIYLYCRSGNRSGKATDILHQMGHTEAVNIGAFDALVRAGAQVA